MSARRVATEWRRSFLRLAEDKALAAAVSKWIHAAEVLRADSEVLQALPNLSGPALSFLFQDRAASTLSKHLSAWKGCPANLCITLTLW